jgi:inorganic pyrophosphatase|tara:strand:+ start:1294 stop:1488 length:195 start_codon:yes stop_codon:yes gene_type:complete
MDTTRWKSILVPREVYEEIKELSKIEGRTIGGQLRLVFDWYKENEGDKRAIKKTRKRANTQTAR